jgi:nitrite reductase/ring-hydroxylating ferredoxin subunit/uncharacterized membrane protein
VANETAVDLVAKQQWLGNFAETVAPLVRKVFEAGGEDGGAIKDFLHGKWLGHPLHPALTAIPIGAWTAALVLDSVELMSDSRSMGKGADAAVAIGLAGAVGSAITGLTDWSETDGRARTIGAAHGVLNLSAAALYATSLALRGGKARRKAIGLSMLGYAVAGAAAYLGGHLVFGEQIGVDHTATSNVGKPESFTPVLVDNELREGTPKRVMANNVAILLVRNGGRLFAITETCPHLGGPLSEGKLEGDSIRCPWHGSRFCLADGKVEDGPATFDARRYEVRVQNGIIEVRAARG